MMLGAEGGVRIRARPGGDRLFRNPVRADGTLEDWPGHLSAIAGAHADARDRITQGRLAAGNGGKMDARGLMAGNQSGLKSAGESCAERQPETSFNWEALRFRLGVDLKTWLSITRRAASLGVQLQEELLASGIASEEALVRELSHTMGIRFLPSIRAEGLIVTGEQAVQAVGRAQGLPILSGIDRLGRCVLLVAPHDLDLDRFSSFLARHPQLRSGIYFVSSGNLRGALELQAREVALRKALAGLKEAFPDYSASRVLSGRQGVMIGSGLVAGLTCLLHWPGATLLALQVIISLFCFACVAFKLRTVTRTSAPAEASLFGASAGEMPVYTVMVALYREADVVSQLMTSLGRLVWPRSKLEVVLVCECDDHETLDAIRALELRELVRVVEVPVSEPRTKPKALSYALPLSTGEYVAVFDAEDRPHPGQLLEAWRAFRSGGETLACVQAPLVITNGATSWLSRMFAFEYAALFSLVLPWLAERQLVLPLGGTSNHFRRSALEGAGAWDPYNVTEDADLGIRLCRMGCMVGTISSPTCEDAPTDLDVWLRQRTRWFKGWIQTWLVHMRHPVRLFREVGPGSFLVIQILVPCALTAVLSNVVLVAALILGGAWLAVTGRLPDVYAALLILDLTNIVLGYGGFLASGWISLRKQDRVGFWHYAALTPVYWLMLSLAAWRALWQLYRCPHHWEKTPHLPRRRAVSRAHDPAGSWAPGRSGFGP